MEKRNALRKDAQKDYDDKRNETTNVEGEQGEQGITVRTSESISSTRAESEYFFIAVL